MTNEKTLKKQEELFAKDCKLINLKYEYMGYTGQEKWAIVSELYRKRQNTIEPVGIRVICQCLMEWRNREIQAKRHGAVDAINGLLIRFTR